MTSDPESDYTIRKNRQRLAMRATPEGKFLWNHCGMDYYDTESSARRVAETAVGIIQALHAELGEKKQQIAGLEELLESYWKLP